MISSKYEGKIKPSLASTPLAAIFRDPGIEHRLEKGVAVIEKVGALADQFLDGLVMAAQTVIDQLRGISRDQRRAAGCARQNSMPCGQ